VVDMTDPSKNQSECRQMHFSKSLRDTNF